MEFEPQKSPRPDESGGDPQVPNEGATGHNPDEQDERREDEESEQSFPASDPPANY
jgi:hypothetical protein